MSEFKDFIVVRELYPEAKGWFWKTQKCPAVDFKQESAWALTAEGTVCALADARACDDAVARGQRVFAVCLQPKIPFAQTVMDVCMEHGWKFNYVLSGEIGLDSIPKFLEGWVKNEGACGIDGIHASQMLSTLWDSWEVLVRDQIGSCHADYRVVEIEERGVIPRMSWNQLLVSSGDALTDGLKVNVIDARFVSPDRDLEAKAAAVARAERERNESARKAYQAAVDGKTQAAELQRLEQDRLLKQLQFEQEKAALEADVARQKIDVDIYQQRQLNQAKIDLQKALNDEEIRKDEALRNHETEVVAKVSEKVASLVSSLEEVTARIDQMAANLASQGVSEKEAQDWHVQTLVDPVMSPHYQGMSAKFNSVLASVRAQSDAALTISLESARTIGGYSTRSIVNGMNSRDLVAARENQSDSRPINGAIRIGDRLTLRLQSARAGYLTLFNLGTSGTISKIFPNPAFGTTENYIQANHVYTLPGELMPKDSLQDGVWDEVGPVSSKHGLPERVLAILTDDPVVLTERCLQGGASVGGFRTRGGFAAVEEVVSSLDDLDGRSWCCGWIEIEVVG